MEENKDKELENKAVTPIPDDVEEVGRELGMIKN